MQLVIGNKRYSSWSFRPWMVLKQAGIPFKETQIFLRTPGATKKIEKLSPGGRVPVLIDGKRTIWESLAICEYLAEKYPFEGLWPKDAEARSVARSISSEMHAGFQNLRTHLPCHFVARYRNFKIPAEARSDIQRILEIWTGCRKKWGRGGAFLFGNWSIADAMFAPVVFRFLAYGVKVDPVSRSYMKAIESLPATQEWVRQAAREAARIPAYEKK